MTRWAALLALLLAGCSYDELHCQLRVSGLESDSTVTADQRPHQADVYVSEATSTLRPDAVQWRFGGVFVPGDAPGRFRVTGPGEGTLEAVFMAGTTQHLRSTLRVRPSASAWAPTPAPTPTPEPIAPPTPAPTPVAIATPTPPDPDVLVQQAYQLAGNQHYFDALERVAGITDPDWLPKVRSLEAEWGSLAAEQGFKQVRAALDRGDRLEARHVLEQIALWPLKPGQRQTETQLRRQLDGR